MFAETTCRQLGRRASLTSLPLLLSVLSGCSDHPATVGPVELQEAFPSQGPRVLDGARAFGRTAAGDMVLNAEPSPWRPRPVEVTLPEQSEQPIRLRTDEGLDLQLTELGASGPIRLVEDDVASYRSQGGTSFWRAVPGGAEQWLVLPDGVPSASEPVARWHVAGGALSETSAGVEIENASGTARLQVMADEAYGPGEQPLSVHLAVSGQWLSLYVDASPGPVLVDPEWLNMATVATARKVHGAALLPSGNVLVTGGFSTTFTPFDSSEIYDFSTHGWGAGPTMLLGRSYHTSTALDTGDVLIAGGYDGTGMSFYEAELYVTASNSFAARPDMSVPRAAHSATKLDDGRVLICGGAGVLPSAVPWGGSGCFGSIADCQVYDPTSFGGDWVDSAWMSNGRYAHAAALLSDGRVLVAGGENCGFFYDGAEVYDPVGGNFSSTTSMNVTRAYHTLTTLTDGRVLATGGNSGGASVSTAELWSPTSGTWTNVASMNTARSEHTATLLDDGTVLVVGGTDFATPTAAAEIYDPSAGTWTPVDPIPGARGLHTATTLDASTVLVTTGGPGSSGALDTSYEFTITATPTCVTSVDCTPAQYCEPVSGDCLPDKPDGDPAVDPDECQSGLIADGVCCDTACNAGVCDACTAALGASADGTCTDVGASCGDDLECTLDSCDPALGCISTNRLDGSSCTDGVCVAGACVPDGTPLVQPDAGAGGSPPIGTGGGESFDEPQFPGDPVLEGGGICSLARPGDGTGPGHHAAWLLLMAAGALRRRSR